MQQNLLQQALQVLGYQEVAYLAFEKNTLQPDGLLMPTYKSAIKLKGAFQPIQTTQKLSLGLSLDVDYARFFVSANLIGFQEDRANDLIVFHNKTYAITSISDWYFQQGWKELFLTKTYEQNNAR